MTKDCWRASVFQTFDRLFVLCFYGGLVKDCMVGLSGLWSPGCIMGVKEVVLACMCDSAPGWRPRAWGECTLDSEPGWGSPSFPCRSAALCLDAGPTPAPSAPPAAPPRGVPVTFAPVRANPELSCCAYTHRDLAESNRWSHSEYEEGN